MGTVLINKHHESCHYCCPSSSCLSEADPYTIGQVNAGLTNGGVITGVDYGHGVVSGLGAVGTGRTVAAVAHAPLTYTAGVAPVAAVAHAPVAYTAGVAHAPVAYTAGVAHAPLTYTAGVAPVHHLGYAGVHNLGYYGKRSANAEPYTVAQIAHGAHIANAAAEGRLHNVGVITNAVIAPAHLGYSGYGAPYAGYAAHVGYPYVQGRKKREADAQYGVYPYHALGYAGVGVVNGVAPHAVAHTPYGLTHSSNVGVCTNYV